MTSLIAKFAITISILVSYAYQLLDNFIERLIKLVKYEKMTIGRVKGLLIVYMSKMCMG